MTSALDKARDKRDAREEQCRADDLKALAPFIKKYEALMDQLAPIQARMRSQNGKAHSDLVMKTLRTGYDYLQRAQEG